MAEAALLGVAKSVLGKLSSPALKELLLLWNLDKDINRLKQTIQTITHFLLDAEKRESEELVKGWLARLREILYDADDLFDAIDARALRKKVMPGNAFKREVRLFFSKSNHLGFINETARDIKAIRERLDDINNDILPFKFQSLNVENNFPLMNLNRETHSFVDVQTVIGRDEDREEIVSLLLSEETAHLNVSVISIIGFGGLGKTTLAQLVYNDDRVKKGGFDLCLWACINYFSDLELVLVTILTSILKSKPQDLDLDQLQQKLRESINGKRILLVLDDVWEENASNWDKLETLLKCGKSGSKILATTRSAKVAECLNAVKPYYHLNILSKESSWDLFAKSAFVEGEINNDPEIFRLGEQIVHKCGHVPLAVITVGRMLRCSQKDKKTWLSVVNNELTDVLSENKDDQIMKVLMISYNGLPHVLKRCFAYSSIFPKGWQFCKHEMICMWAAQSFIEPLAAKSLEEVGNTYFCHMVDMCFFQVAEMDTSKGYPLCKWKMHDLLHDLAKQVARDEIRCFSREEDLDGMGGSSSLRHLFVSCHLNLSFEPLVRSPPSKTLRTLILAGGGHFKTSSLSLLLERFKMLRTLRLSLDVDVLPDSFAALIHLRDLDLSWNKKMKKIPNSICKLQHLQTLDLRGCCSLMELPLKLGKLVSLRHLFLEDCSKLESLPPGLSEITTLVKLDRLIVHPTNGGLRYLGCLDLYGVVKMELPVKGWSDCVEDARKSNMSQKHKLNEMIINWTGKDEHEATKKEIEAVLDAIEPHENLEYLSIKGYVGDKLSSWVFSLPNLKELRLYECTLEYLYHENVNFESFLPCLEILEMESLRNLKGWWGDISSISASPSLPRVSKLLICKCPNLVEGMPLFRGIEELRLYEVHGKLVEKLLSMGTPNLKVIRLFDVKYLSCVPRDLMKCLTSLKTFEIYTCEDLRLVSSCGLGYLTALEDLGIFYSDNVKWEDKDEDSEKEEMINNNNNSSSSSSSSSSSGLGMLWKALKRPLSLAVPWQRHLQDEDAEKEEMINNNNSGLGMPWIALKRLRSLAVPWQRHLQEGLHDLTALKRLTLGYYEIKQVEEDNKIVEKELHIPTIQVLEIGFTGMSYSCFPKWIQRLHFLKELQFSSCMELSISWAILGNMNLQQLTFDCVETVVSVDEMEMEQQNQFSKLIQLQIIDTKDGSWIHDIPWKHLTSLQKLDLIYCSLEIRDRYKRETGEDWHLISHIPTVYIK